MLYDFLTLIVIPIPVGIVTTVISEWLIRKYLDKGDKK